MSKWLNFKLIFIFLFFFLNLVWVGVPPLFLHPWRLEPGSGQNDIPYMNLKHPADQTPHACNESQTQHQWRLSKHTRLTDVWYFYVLYQCSKWRTFANPHWPYCTWVIQTLDFTQDPLVRCSWAVPAWTRWAHTHKHLLRVKISTWDSPNFNSIQRRHWKAKIRSAKGLN